MATASKTGREGPRDLMRVGLHLFPPSLESRLAGGGRGSHRPTKHTHAVHVKTNGLAIANDFVSKWTTHGSPLPSKDPHESWRGHAAQRVPRRDGLFMQPQGLVRVG